MPLLDLIACDAAGQRIGSLDAATEVSVVGALRQAQVASFRLPADGLIAESLEEHRTRIRVEVDGILVAHLVVASCQDTIALDGERVEVTAADPWSTRLARRFARSAVAYVDLDQAEIVRRVVGAQNARFGTLLSTRASDATQVMRTATIERDTNAADFIDQLAQAVDGFDFGVVPVDSAGVIGELRVWPRRGVRREHLELGYGQQDASKNNLSSVTVTNDAERVTTDQRVLGADPATQRSERTNTATRAHYATILDSVDTFADMTTPSLIGLVADQLLEWRKRPRQIVSVTPAGTFGFTPWLDFDLGDEVRLHVDGGRFSGPRAISGWVRVYGWTITRDESGEVSVDSIDLAPADQGGGAG